MAAHRKILVASAKMAVATFASRILGLVREQVMAAVFGASGITDAFTIAYRVPNMLRDLFAEGAFSSAFVPVFTEVRHRDEQEARRLLWSLFVVLGGLTLIIAAVIFIFAPQVVMLMAKDKFTADPERFQVTVLLVRIMAPFLTLVSLAALFMGALNALKVFFVPSLAPAFFNVMMIACMLLLPPWLEERGMHAIFSMGFGVIAGGLAQMLVQVPMLFKKNYGPVGPLRLISESSKKIAHRVGIGTIGIAATQINIIITTILATGTVLGAVSWLNYAFRLFQFPVGILSVSVAGSNLVHFSDAWKAGDRAEAIETLRSSYFLALLTIVPAFCLLYALSTETVHIIFERGAFDRQDTLMTTHALHFYLFGLPFYGLYKIFAPCFFTLDRPRIPVTISVIAIALNIVFCVTLVPRFGFTFLALGTSLSMMLNSTLQATMLARLLKLRMNFFIYPRLFKVLTAGVGCFAAAWSVRLQWMNFGQPFYHKIFFYIVAGSCGALSYALILLAFGEGKALRKVLRVG